MIPVRQIHQYSSSRWGGIHDVSCRKREDAFRYRLQMLRREELVKVCVYQNKLTTAEDGIKCALDKA